MAANRAKANTSAANAHAAVCDATTAETLNRLCRYAIIKCGASVMKYMNNTATIDRTVLFMVLLSEED